MRYAVIQDEVCVNIVVAGETFAAEMGFVEIPEHDARDDDDHGVKAHRDLPDGHIPVSQL